MSTGQAIVSGTEMRSAEAAIFAQGTDSFALMTAAGSAVAAAILKSHPGGTGAALVLCGPGNNGGDGFVIAERLRQAGWRVRVAASRSREGYKGDAARAAVAWQGDIMPLDPVTLGGFLPSQTVVVDALFGIGLDRAPDKIFAAVIDLVNQSRVAVWAVDVPSGVETDSGQIPGNAIRAKHTVTFGWLKPGHLLLPGRENCGIVEVAGLGFDAKSLPPTVSTWVNGPGSWLQALPEPGPLDHKYSRGHAVVIGSNNMPGAGRLAALSARRMGVGMLSVAAPAATLPIFMADQPGIIARPASRPEDFVEILMDRRVSAVLVGSGLVPTAAARETVLTSLAAGRAAVVDGGGLTAFADRPEELFTLGRPNVVLTPHEGEFARLFPDLGPALGKLARVRQAASRAGSVVVLKGADTVIAEPLGTAVINGAASPYLATAGSGDVLAGMILGLLAQGMKPYQAAAAGTWFHAQAGISLGAGLIAEDLAGQIPALFQRLGR